MNIYLKKKLKILINKFEEKTSSFRTTITQFAVLSTIGGLSLIYLYNNIQKIRKKMNTPSHQINPALHSKSFQSKMNRNRFDLPSLVLPAYSSKTKEIGHMVVDFTLEASHEDTKNYFKKNSHLFEDLFNRSLEPIQLSFPLQPEGKMIIKEKIIYEANKFLKKMHLEGKITNIYIKKLVGN